LENDESIDHPQSDPDGIVLESDNTEHSKKKCCWFL